MHGHLPGYGTHVVILFPCVRARSLLTCPARCASIRGRCIASHTGIVTRDDLLRALGHSIQDEEIDRMFSQLGVNNTGKLYFTDLLRLLRDEGRLNGQAGIRSKSVGFKPTSLHDVGKSASLSDLVSSAEAKASAEAQEATKRWGALKGGRNKLLQKGRTVQNLNRFIKEAGANLGEESSARGGGGGGGGVGGAAGASNGATAPTAAPDTGVGNESSEAERAAAMWMRRSVSKDGSAVVAAAARI